MSETPCREARRALDLGLAEEAGDHLESCADCRRFASVAEPLLGLLARSAEVEPPRSLDRKVRSLLAPDRPVRRPLTFPVAAVVLGVATPLLLGVGLALALAQTSLGAAAALAAPLIVVSYLGIASTALLPLLLNRSSIRARAAEKVRP